MSKTEKRGWVKYLLAGIILLVIITPVVESRPIDITHFFKNIFGGYFNFITGMGGGAVPMPDTDGDGVSDSTDNCVNTPNSNQADSDGDGIGNVCDNCPDTYNPDQADSDGDGAGDLCDAPQIGDSDGDGTPDSSDNCPNDANANQANADGDAYGDTCDPCPTLTVHDADSDTYLNQGGCTTGTDCNDNNAAVHPGVTEICGNSIDDNCDTQAEEGCEDTTDCVDNDDDGYSSCVDCSDDDAAVHQNAVENCHNN